MTEITIFRAALAGLISFISPCLLPLIPAYAALLVALSLAGHEGGVSGRRTVFISLAFISGFLLIFIMTGAPFFSGYIAQSQGFLRIIGAVLTILTGLFAGIAQLSKRTGINPGLSNVSLPLALIIGMGFASGWTPCIGPTLGLILVNASTQGTAAQGVLMLITYSLGLAVPFLLVTLVLYAVLNLRGCHLRFRGSVIILAGIILVAMGVILLMDNLRQLTPLFPDFVSY
ncbi:MAG: hypothetical protein HZA17_04485 [Nitrospirae bacterium]|nr:hypothetical protein [Nitrospirota bacterium]